MAIQIPHISSPYVSVLMGLLCLPDYFMPPPSWGGCVFNRQIMNPEIQPTSLLDLAGVAVATPAAFSPAPYNQYPELTDSRPVPTYELIKKIPGVLGYLR